jgi:nitrogen fixation NifU-like protein
MDGDRVKNARFEGQGCAISTASASLMTEALKGRTRGEVEALFHQMHETCTGQPDAEAAGQPKVDMGKLAVFEGVRQYPLRVKCATLAWHTLKNALAGEHAPAKTE